VTTRAEPHRRAGIVPLAPRPHMRPRRSCYVIVSSCGQPGKTRVTWVPNGVLLSKDGALAFSQSLVWREYQARYMPKTRQSMVRAFHAGEPAWALRAYLVLIGCAARHETVTYEQLARRIKRGGPNFLAKPLDALNLFTRWCRQKETRNVLWEKHKSRYAVGKGRFRGCC